jgi:hypothetical protein
VYFEEKRLYHQIHPAKLFTDVAVTPISLYFLWQHQVWFSIITAFVPPILVSSAMMIWPPVPHLERIRASAAGRYLKRFMTPTVEATRLLSLVPMAFGAWAHQFWPIGLGMAILSVAWANGFLFPRKGFDRPV